MKELMIHVERIVRPVRADWSKLRIRRELLAHLQAAFDEERARGLDEAAAVAEAKRRLGDPGELTREIQASVSRLEQLVATPFPRAAGPLFATVCTVVPLLLATMTGFAHFSSGRSRGVFVGGMLVVELNAALLSAFSIEFIRPHVRWARVAWAGIGAVIAQFAWMLLMAYSLTGKFLPHDLADMGLALFAVPAFCGTMGIVAILGNRRAKQWLDLEIAA